MNRIYKLKFNQTLQQVQVVSELANQTVAHTTVTATDSSRTHRTLYSLTTKLHSALSTIIKSSMIMTSLVGLGWSLHSQASATTSPQVSHLVGTHGQVGTVVAGTATAVTDGLVTTINNSPNAIINWQSFNINQNELLKFVQQSTDSAVLNRVVGGDVSKILGSLQSNGQVFVINPNGIIFGQNSHVNVGSLVASTLEINNKDFLDKHYVFNHSKDQKIAQVLNAGMIKVNANGSLALIGGQVLNQGILEARHGTVFLLAGQTIEIADLNNPQISYKVTAQNKAVNLGQIFGQNAMLLGNKVLNGQTSVYAQSSFADLIGATDQSRTSAHINAQGQVVLFGGSTSDQLQSSLQTDAQVLGNRNAIVINNGTINVSNARGKAGKVQVLGDLVSLESHSQIQATGQQGGEVILGGDATGRGNIKVSQLAYFDQGQTVNVSASTVDGNAGHIVVWSDRTQVNGNFIATSEQGSGGFIETSGHAIGFSDDLHINTSSQAGHHGTWLIDPSDLAFVKNDQDIEQFKGKPVGKDTDVIFPTTVTKWDSTELTADEIYQTYDYREGPVASYLTQDTFNQLIKKYRYNLVFHTNHSIILHDVYINDIVGRSVNSLTFSSYHYEGQPTNAFKDHTIANSAIWLKDVHFSYRSLTVNLEGSPYVLEQKYGFNPNATLTVDNVSINSINNLNIKGFTIGNFNQLILSSVNNTFSRNGNFSFTDSQLYTGRNNTFEQGDNYTFINSRINFTNEDTEHYLGVESFRGNEGTHINLVNSVMDVSGNLTYQGQYLNLTNTTVTLDTTSDSNLVFNVAQTTIDQQSLLSIPHGSIQVYNEPVIVDFFGENKHYDLPHFKSFSLANSTIKAREIKLNTDIFLDIANSTLTSTNSTSLSSVNLQIKDHSQINAGQDLAVLSNTSEVKILNSTLSSNQHNFTLSAPRIITNNATISAQTVKMSYAEFNAFGYGQDLGKFSGYFYDLNHNVHKEISLNNSTITAAKDINLNATLFTPINIDSTNFTTNDTGSVNIEGNYSVTLSGTATINSAQNINIASNYSLSILGTEQHPLVFNSPQGSVYINNYEPSYAQHRAGWEIIVKNLHINAKDVISIKSAVNTYHLQNVNFQTSAGKIDLSADHGSNTIANSVLVAPACYVKLPANDKNISLTNVNYVNCGKDEKERPLSTYVEPKPSQPVVNNPDQTESTTTDADHTTSTTPNTDKPASQKETANKQPTSSVDQTVGKTQPSSSSNQATTKSPTATNTAVEPATDSPSHVDASNNQPANSHSQPAGTTEQNDASTKQKTNSQPPASQPAVESSAQQPASSPTTPPTTKPKSQPASNSVTTPVTSPVDTNRSTTSKGGIPWWVWLFLIV